MHVFLFFLIDFIFPMQRLLQIIEEFKQYIALCFFVIISFSLMALGDLSQFGGLRSVVVATIGVFQEAFSFIPNPVALKSENSSLRDLNAQLSYEVQKSRQSSIENDKLRSLLTFKSISKLPLVPAEVVGKTIGSIRSYITLNRGTASGIAQGMAVMTDRGLVGVVASVSENFAIVSILKNRDIRVAARLESTRLDGVVYWEDDEFLVMKNIPKTYSIQKGEIVVTSEYSTKFPPNIPIGKVLGTHEDPNSLFATLKIQSFAQFETLEQVFVITQLPNPERIYLEERYANEIAVKTTNKKNVKKQTSKEPTENSNENP